MMTLAQIAEQMKKTASEKGNAHWVLQRDLRLTLYERENDLVLCISRPTALAVPSEREIDICQKAFLGDQTLKIVNGQTRIWSERKCYLAVEKCLVAMYPPCQGGLGGLTNPYFCPFDRTFGIICQTDKTFRKYVSNQQKNVKKEIYYEYPTIF